MPARIRLSLAYAGRATPLTDVGVIANTFWRLLPRRQNVVAEEWLRALELPRDGSLQEDGW